MSQRYRVASVADVPAGTSKEFVIAGRIVALFHIDDQFYALDGICPHAGGPLAQGHVSGTIVTCPWHGWQFNVTTGRNCLNSHLCQTSFPLVVEGDDVFIEMP